jgi:hypothetical protein
MAKVTSIEEYLVDRINKKYAERVFRKVNTEWERLLMEGSEPGKTEYEWMLKRAMEIHRQLNTPVPEKQEETENDEKAEN